MIKWIVLICIIGYLLGSVPFALVIGKVFFKTDVRLSGSRNLGGSNAGRVLGARAGLAVMTLDVLKVIAAIGLASLLPADEPAMIASGLCAALGHCFPLFAGFKVVINADSISIGGKAVATTYGFYFGMMLFGGYSPLLFFLPLITFLVILYLTKIVALSSIGSTLAVTLYQWLSTGFSPMIVALLVFDVLIIWRHRANIVRIAKHQENKIKWM